MNIVLFGIASILLHSWVNQFIFNHLGFPYHLTFLQSIGLFVAFRLSLPYKHE
jgi:hypothetical protein